MIQATSYLKDCTRAIGAKTLNTSRCEVAESIRQTAIERLSRLANSSGKGWPNDPEAQSPYSFIPNVTSPSDGS